MQLAMCPNKNGKAYPGGGLALIGQYKSDVVRGVLTCVIMSETKALDPTIHFSFSQHVDYNHFKLVIRVPTAGFGQQ